MLTIFMVAVLFFYLFKAKIDHKTVIEISIGLVVIFGLFYYIINEFINIMLTIINVK
jgi:hypothetical protein